MRKKNKIFLFIGIFAFVFSILFSGNLLKIETTKADTFQKNKLTWFNKPLLNISQNNNFSFDLKTTDLQNIYYNSRTYNDFYENVRRLFLKNLVDSGFTGFISKPYNTTTKYPITNSGNKLTYVQKISQSDNLDILISKYLRKYKFLYSNIFFDGYYENMFLIKGNPIFLSDLNIKKPKNFSGVYLFKNQKDLDMLGYKIISRRNRKNTDKSYRRYNIYKAFENIGKIRVLNPGQKFSYLKNINYDPKKRKNYKVGESVVGNEVRHEYGGGLCGGSTAIYQGVFSNKGFKILDRRNHSLRVTKLYAANINGENINFPGLDSTIYEGQQDLIIKNTTDHPLIFVAEMDDKYGSSEVNFSLGFEKDKGTRNYIGKKVGGNSKCYTWEINGKNINSCYKIRLKPEEEKKLENNFYTGENI